MSQASTILQKSPAYNAEADKMIEKYELVQNQLKALEEGNASELTFLYPASQRIPSVTFGWPIVKYAIRQHQMDQLMSMYYKNGELMNTMIARNRNTFTL